MKIFDYTSLSSQKDQLIQAFHEKGIIALRGVPGFEKAQDDFILSSQKFMALSEEKRNKYTPEDAYGRGWSYGIETFNNVTDAYKGSYYMTYPEDKAIAPNVWPCVDVPDFKLHF